MDDRPPTQPTPRHRIACVSFLNSKPLIEPLMGRPDVQIHFAVPSALLALVDAGDCTVGLLSIVDYQLAEHELLLVPVGVIACDGPTLTVRIFSKVPPAQIKTLHGDTDSHTSVLLAQIILRELYKTSPAMLPLNSQQGLAGQFESLLLIGDKVVNAAPQSAEYPYQLDLGEQWKLLTGLPFVFACWMMRADTEREEANEAACLLGWARQQGAAITEQILDKYAEARHWPRDLARRYFTEYLRYEVTPQSRRGMAQFFALTTKHGLLNSGRPLRYFECHGA